MAQVLAMVWDWPQVFLSLSALGSEQSEQGREALILALEEGIMDTAIVAALARLAMAW